MTATAPGEVKELRTEVLRRLKTAIQREVKALRPDEHMTRVAWAVRNILELWIWTGYCVRSEADAKRFGEDCARDAIGAFTNMPQSLCNSPVSELEKERQGLIQKAKSGGIPDIEDPYRRVANAARELGKEAEFSYLNKILSKCAHPTALVVMMESNPKARDTVSALRKKFCEGGIGFAKDALAQIDAFSS